MPFASSPRSALAIRQGVEIFFFSFLSLVSRLSSYFLPHTHTQTSSREQGRAREQRKPGGKISGVTRENSGEKFPLSPATAKGKKTVCEKARRGCGSKSFFFPLFFFFLASLPFFFFSLSRCNLCHSNKLESIFECPVTRLLTRGRLTTGCTNLLI